MRSLIQFLCFYIAIFSLSCNTSDNKPDKVEPKEPRVSTLAEDIYGGTGGLSVDANGNVYSSDFGPFLGRLAQNFTPSSKIFKITPDGQVSIFADSLVGASGSYIDEQGNFYQSNIRGGFVTTITPDGRQTVVARDSVRGPVGVTKDDQGNLVICNCGNGSLIKVDPDGVPTPFSQGEIFRCPNGITKDDDGNFYVANFYDGNILKITPDGTASVFATIPGQNNGHITYHDGLFYVVARAAHQIYTVSKEGVVNLFAGSGERGRANGDLLEASFNFPNDLEFSPDGSYLYINEEADTLGDPRILTPTVVRKIRMTE